MKKCVAYAAVALMLAAVPAWSAPNENAKPNVPTTAVKLAGKISKANQLPDVTPDSNVERKAIPDVYKWDLSSLCKSDAEFYDRLAKVSKERETLSRYKGKLSDPETLRACIAKYLATDMETSYLAMYANLRFTTYQDNNDLQIDGHVGDVCSPYPIDEKFAAFNFHVINVNAHDFDELRAAFAEARATKGQPTAIIAHSVKGKGVSFMENQAGWHGKAPNDEQYAAAMAELEAIDKELEKAGEQ